MCNIHIWKLLFERLQVLTGWLANRPRHPPSSKNCVGGSEGSCIPKNAPVGNPDLMGGEPNGFVYANSPAGNNICAATSPPPAVGKSPDG